MMPFLFVLWLQANPPHEAMESIRADEAFEHVRVLASDEYEGRGVGTAGDAKAVEYIVGHLKKWKLAPAGKDGGFVQPFRIPESTHNVLAMREGADEKRKAQVVAIGAHFDHLGRGARRSGDAIYNGADDNASGTAVVLEIAQAFGELDTPPARTVLFAWWSAEERGLLGSKHFVSHPTVPIDSIVAYLNLDMVGRNEPDRIDIEGTGCSPDLRALFDRVNRGGFFREINYDVVHVKADTDHYPFYRAGVPAVEFFSGYHADYHAPTDSAEKIAKEKLERVGRFVARAIWELANATERPAYRKTGR